MRKQIQSKVSRDDWTNDKGKASHDDYIWRHGTYSASFSKRANTYGVEIIIYSRDLNSSDFGGVHPFSIHINPLGLLQLRRFVKSVAFF